MVRASWRVFLAVILFGFVALTGAAPAFASPVRADVNDFTFDSFDGDYTLSRADDGTSRLQVVETLVARFPDTDQNRGIRRMIPALYQDVDVNPQVQSVTDENGTPRPMEVSRNGDFVEVVSRADDYLHGAQTYVITYTLQNTTRTFTDVEADEFYWDVNGNEWAQPFGTVSMTLHVDPSLTAALNGNAACYVGGWGSTDTCPISNTDGSTLEASAHDLTAGQTMTVGVGFAQGTFVQAPKTASGSPLAASLQPVGIGVMAVAGAASVAAVGGAVIARRRALRDDPGHPTVIPQYEPPAGVDAMAAAVMLGRRARGVPAEVLEQAVRGSIVLVDGGGSGTHRLSARLVDPRRSGDRDGQELLRAMFGDTPHVGQEFAFGGYDPDFAGESDAILRGVHAEQVAGGVWRPVRRGTRAVPVTFGVIALVLGFAIFALMILGGAPPWGFALIPVGFISLGVAVGLTRKRPYSALGANLRDHLKGLELFMQWAEADRIRMLQSPQGAERVQVDTNDPRQMLKLYEPLLPYAVVFGIETQWVKQLTVLYDTIQYSPYWYGSSTGFNPVLFGTAIGSMNSAVSSTTTAPSSASSGGSSSFGGSTGGGFAGGGGGGGGGGGV